MTGKMLKTDWLAMNYYWGGGIFILLIVLMTAYSLPLLVIPIAVFGVFSFSVNPFAVEDKGKLDHLYLTLPVRRRDIVRGRFALSLLMQTVAYLVGIPVMLMVGTIRLFGNSVDINGMMIALICAFGVLLYGILNISTFPVLFKIGYVKGQVIGFYLPMILVMVVTIIATLFFQNDPEFFQKAIGIITYVFSHGGIVAAGLILIGLALLGASYGLSLRWYEKRDF